MKTVYFDKSQKVNSGTSEQELVKLGVPADSFNRAGEGKVFEFFGRLYGATDDKRLRLYINTGSSDQLMFDSGSGLNNLDNLVWNLTYKVFSANWHSVEFKTTGNAYSSANVRDFPAVGGDSITGLMTVKITVECESDAIMSYQSCIVHHATNRYWI